MDWQETLERAIPQPPPTHPDPAALLADGKKLVRRRRLAEVAGTAVAVAAVVGIGAVVVPSRESATPNPPIATHSTSTDEAWPPRVDIPLSDDAPVAYDFDTGEVTFQEGWTEVDRVAEPTGISDTLAVAATDGKTTIYAYFLDVNGIFIDASRTTKDFQTWAHDISNSTPGISWEAGGTVKVRGGGWTLVREISNPFDYDAPWDSVGAIVERDGIEEWVFFRESSATDYFMGYGHASTYAIPGRTIEDWLADIEEAEPASDRPDRVHVDPTQTDVVEFSGSKVVPTEDGVKVLDQLANPDIGHSFAAGTSQTAAARITVNGEERYVLVQEKEKGETGRPATWAFSYTLLPAPRAEDRTTVSLEEFAARVKEHTVPGDEPWWE